MNRNHRDDKPSADDKDAQADESFAQRWSRRKLEAQPTHEPAPPINVTPAEPEPEPEPLGDEDMPPLDSIGPDSDVSAFFSPRVSETLRQAALQRMFRQPQFNYSDGLDVYAGDYRHFKPLGEMVTAAMRHRLEVARERLAQLTEQSQHPVDGTAVAPGDDSALTTSTDGVNDAAKDATDPNTDDHGHT